MAFDLNNPVGGLYVVTRTVKLEKPDGRARRGWESPDGVSAGDVVRVTVYPKPPFNERFHEGHPDHFIEACRQLHNEKPPVIEVALPGRYHSSRDSKNLWLATEDNMYGRFFRELIACMVLKTDGLGLLAAIRNDKDYDWQAVLVRLLSQQLVTRADVSAVCDALDAEEAQE